MVEKRSKRIPIQVSQNEYHIIRDKAQKANMTISDLIRTSVIEKDPIIIIDRSEAISEHLCDICSEIQALEYEFPRIKGNFGNLKNEVMELWHMLNG